jgi:hypothetical protein
MEKMKIDESDIRLFKY